MEQVKTCFPEKYKYIERVFRHMKFFNTVFEKAYIFDTECEYKSICAAYQNDSHTCRHEVDKSYCGNYRQFL